MNNLRYLTPMKGEPPAPPAWAPTDKSGLLLWFKTDSGVTESGGLVTQWNDAGGGTNATASGSTRPTYTASVLNGKPGISFPSGTYMDFGSATLFPNGAPFSIIMVVQNQSEGGTWYHGVLALKSTSGNRGFGMLFTNDSSYSDLTFGEFDTSPGPNIKAATDFTTSPAAALINYNGGTTTSTGSWSLLKDGASQTLSASANGAVNVTVNRLGNWYDGGLPLVGSLFEMFAYSSECDAGDIANIQQYIYNRWGVWP